MSFWSGEKLAERIAEIADQGNPSMIDCSAVKLTIGAEVYVSPIEAKGSTSIRTLAPNEAFAIPPGQFAFLITEERVRVPKDAMAFISIRARTKWRGLVNVSGFHADPGYEGRLIFSVLNGGPSSVHLRRGEYCFLMWLADLDRPTKDFARREAGYDRIPSELVNNIGSEFKTVSGVSKAVDDLRLEVRLTQGGVGVAFALVVAMAIHSFWPTAQNAGPAPVSNTTSAASSTTAPPTRRPAGYSPVPSAPPRG